MKVALFVFATALVLSIGQFAQANSDVRQPLNLKSSDDPAINEVEKARDTAQSGSTCPLINASMKGREDATAPLQQEANLGSGGIIH